MPPGVESNTKKTQIGRLTKTVSSSGQVTTVEERPHLAVNDTGELVIQEWKRNNNGNSSASSNEVWGASSKQVPATMLCIKILMVLALQFIVNHTLVCFPVGHLNYSPGLKEALGQQGVF